MTRRVLVGAAVIRKAHDEFGEARTTDGSASEYDFEHDPDYWQLLRESTDT